MSQALFLEIFGGRGNLTFVSTPISAKALGLRLKEARGSRKQEAIANAAGISTETLSRLEKGHVPNPRLRTLENLANALSVTLFYLLGGAPEPVREGDWLPLPLVAQDVAAGPGTLPQPTDRIEYAFRPEWKALKPPLKDRYCLVRLKKDARSMEPDIRAGSIILLDRAESSRIKVESGMAYLCELGEEEFAVKLPTLAYQHGKPVGLTLSSRNPIYEPVFRAFERGKSVQDVLRAKVIWHGTEW